MAVVFHSSITALPPDQEQIENALVFYLKEGGLKKGTAARNRCLRILKAFRNGRERRESDRG